MSEIRKYVIVDKNDEEGTFEYDDFNEAVAEAKRQGDAAVSANIYTYDDRELVWTPNGADTWPPEN